MKQTVVTICRKYSNHFEGQSKRYTGWFNLDHEFLRRKFSTLETDLYTKLYEKNMGGQDMKPYKMFLLQFDTTKLNLLCVTIQLKIG